MALAGRRRAVTGREHVAVGSPPSVPAALRGCPRGTLTNDRTLVHAHSTSNGPWWFASAPGGRSNLPTPHGTVYLADSAEVALGFPPAERAPTPYSATPAHAPGPTPLHPSRAVT